MSRPTPETLSHALAFALTVAMGALLLSSQQSMDLKAAVTTPAIQIALEAQPSPPAPAPPVQEPPKPKPTPAHREARQPMAAPLMAAVIAEPADFSPLQDTAASSTAPEPVVKVASGSLDSQYAATLRTNIDSRTAAPVSTEYRLLKPRGEVLVNFTLNRSGLMVGSELARSSGSKLLDHHALEIVRTGHYPPFPGDAFRGESHHSFLITLEFHS